MKLSERKNQRGIALLATLLAVALMTVLVVDFTYSATANYRSAANQMNELRADYLARSAFNVALGLLEQDAEKEAQQPNSPDSLQDAWALPFPPLPVGGGEASLSIVDDNRKLNINNVINPQNGQVNVQFVNGDLTRLFSAAGISTDLIPAIVDWIDPDSVPSNGGAEAEYYMQLIPPYEPRNGPMPTIADLKMIKGVDELSFRRLRNFLTVLPVTQTNINTAPPEVLMARSAQLANDPSLVAQVLKAREQQPFATTLDVTKAVPALSSSDVTTLFTTRSDYFTITGTGQFAGARKILYASVRRNNGQGPVALLSWHED